MQNAKGTELTPWVEKSVALLAPPADWEPNVRGAHARFEARLRQDRPQSAWKRYWLLGAAAASLVIVALLMNPGTRALAQQLWQWMTLGRIEVARVDFDSLPEEAASLRIEAFSKPALPPQIVRDLQEAAQHAGFTPRLPRVGILPGAAQLSVMGPMSFGTVLRAADLELALHRAGVVDETVPPQWDGTRIALQIGATSYAEWPGVTLTQALPPEVSTPSGFDFGAFTTAVLRAAGMDREPAQRFGRHAATAPALLLGIGAEGEVLIREVSLRTGPATLIEDYGDAGQIERVTILWSAPDRVYILSGAISAELATAVANAVD